MAEAHQVVLMISANIGFNVVAYCEAAIVVFVIVSKPQRYFQLGLWPDLAEGL